MEKILLQFKENEYNLFVDKAKSSLKFVQQFINDVNDINGFKTGTEHLKDMLLNTAEKTMQSIINCTMKQIDKAGIRSKGLINSSVQSDKEAFEKLFASFTKPEPEISVLYQIENDKVVINKQALSDAKERFCHYITTERGKLKKEQYHAFLKAANDFFNDNKLFRGGLNFGQFFSLDSSSRFVESTMDFDRL